MKPQIHTSRVRSNFKLGPSQKSPKPKAVPYFEPEDLAKFVAVARRLAVLSGNSSFLKLLAVELVGRRRLSRCVSSANPPAGHSLKGVDLLVAPVKAFAIETQVTVQEVSP